MSNWAYWHCQLGHNRPSTISNNLYFKVHSGTAYSLTATLCGYVSKHFTLCDSSCCNLVVVTWIYFLSFLSDELFSPRPSFELPSPLHQILVTPLQTNVYSKSLNDYAARFCDVEAVVITNYKQWPMNKDSFIVSSTITTVAAMNVTNSQPVTDNKASTDRLYVWQWQWTGY